MIHETADVHPTAQIGPDTKIWHQAQVREGARLGANCIAGKGAYIDFDVTIGRFAMVAAGALVTTDVPDHGLVVGMPARLVGYVCRCGRRLGQGAEEQRSGGAGERVVLWCSSCEQGVEVSREDWERVR